MISSSAEARGRTGMGLPPADFESVGEERETSGKLDLAGSCLPSDPCLPPSGGQFRALSGSVLRLSDGTEVTLDAADHEWASKHKWCTGSVKKYAARKRRDGDRWVTSYLHREIVGAKSGDVVDHIDGNPHNNTRSNLRITDATGNARNTKKEGLKGVTQRPGGRWQARIGVKINGVRKQIHLGRFSTSYEAALAYDYAALKAWGEFASLNFPENNLAAIANKLDLLPDERVSEESVAKKLAAMLASDSTGGAS